MQETEASEKSTGRAGSGDSKDVSRTQSLLPHAQDWRCPSDMGFQSLAFIKHLPCACYSINISFNSHNNTAAGPWMVSATTPGAIWVCDWECWVSGGGLWGFVFILLTHLFVLRGLFCFVFACVLEFFSFCFAYFLSLVYGQCLALAHGKCSTKHLFSECKLGVFLLMGTHKSKDLNELAHDSCTGPSLSLMGKSHAPCSSFSHQSQDCVWYSVSTN